MTPLEATISIAGVDCTKLCHSIRYADRLNGPGSAGFILDDPAGVVVPDEDDSVSIVIDGNEEWTGEVASVEGTFLGELGGTSCRVTATNKAACPQRALENASYTDVAVKSILEEVLSAGHDLHALGITLDPTQVAGPSLTFSAPWWTVETLLQYLSTLTAYPWRITGSGVLKMFPVGAEASGITISVAQGNFIRGTWRRHRFDYRNKQWVIYGPDTDRNINDVLPGDGVTKVFPLSSTTVMHLGPIQIQPDNIWQYLKPYPDPTVEWTYRESDRSIYQTDGYAPLTADQTLHVWYWTKGANAALAQDAGEIAARGIWSKVVQKPEILTQAEALTYGTSLINANKGTPHQPTIVTHEYTLLPGQTVNVDVPQIGLANVTCLVLSRDVWLRDREGLVEPIATLTVLAGDKVRANTFDLWRRIIFGASGSASSAAAAGGGGTTVVTTAGRKYVDLGGDLGRESAPAAGTWVPVPGAKGVVLYAEDFPGGVATVQGWPITRGAGTNVRLRLAAWDGASWVSVGESEYSNATDHLSAAARKQFVAVVEDGHLHLLQMERDNDGENITGRGYIE